jgi:nicotinamide riboside transporter PnuC
MRRNFKKVTVSMVHLKVVFYAAVKFYGIHVGQHPSMNEKKKFIFICKSEEGNGWGGIYVSKIV